MYYRDYDEDAASTGSGSVPSTPATPVSEHHRLFTIPSAPMMGSRAWAGAAPAGGPSETTKEVLQSVLKVRKSWKTLRGGETVWPLELEAALLEGLEAYVPDDSRETRLLGRFPRRNRFISDYIFDKTGKRRSAKQVGSRLQQLRESCGGKKLLHLLSPFRQPYADSSASSDSTCTSPTSPVTRPSGLTQTSPPHKVVCIDILPEGISSSWAYSGRSPSPAMDMVRASDRPRPLRQINPSVAFLSQSALAAQSNFTVYAEGRVVHAEGVQLVATQTPSGESHVYTAALVPGYWQTISDSQDPTRFTIYQEVRRDDALLFSATFKFAYPENNTKPATAPATTHLGSPNLDGGAALTGTPQPRATTTADMDALLSAAFDHPSQRSSANGFSMYWSQSREDSIDRGYHSGSSSGSSGVSSPSAPARVPAAPYACFPPDLTNYVL
ncbi:TEA domain-containing protein [Mycena chlorophos]|uniref:TEA domain-containing protein n=1 Tax=Mycena chlorophos TaxID=658473 RepID=A0A8H6W3L8_MYCCL|nr:TEA domain-containing protein [Mycena chlorophos]